MCAATSRAEQREHPGMGRSWAQRPVCGQLPRHEQLHSDLARGDASFVSCLQANMTLPRMVAKRFPNK